MLCKCLGTVLGSSLCSFYSVGHSLSREIKESAQVLSDLNVRLALAAAPFKSV